MSNIGKTVSAFLGVALLAVTMALPASALDSDRQYAQNYDNRRNMELNDQRVPLESVISNVERRCSGRMINARHDARTNRYIIRWETSGQQIVSIQADASTGRIISTGGC